MKPILIALLWVVLFGCRTNESPEGQMDDLQITAQVKSKLASDVGVSSVTNISVNSTNGVVTLSGQVNSPDVKAYISYCTSSRLRKGESWLFGSSAALAL
jgi:hypothetical protein